MRATSFGWHSKSRMFSFTECKRLRFSSAFAPLFHFVVLRVNVTERGGDGLLRARVVHVRRVKLIPVAARAAEDGKVVAVGQVDPIALVLPQVWPPVWIVTDLELHFHVLKNRET